MNLSHTTPSIIRETSSGLFLCSIQDEMLRRREVEYVGEVTAQSVYSICRQLRHLQQEDPEAEITLYINSPGGEVVSGLALYDVMTGISCPIRTVCMGMAASMGALLFAAGDQRDILPHGEVMIHDPLITQAGGSALALQETSRRLMKLREDTCRILADRTGKSIKEIYRKTAQDSYFTAEEAVAFGLADRVIETL